MVKKRGQAGEDYKAWPAPPVPTPMVDIMTLDCEQFVFFSRYHLHFVDLHEKNHIGQNSMSWKFCLKICAASLDYNCNFCMFYQLPVVRLIFYSWQIRHGVCLHWRPLLWMQYSGFHISSLFIAHSPHVDNALWKWILAGYTYLYFLCVVKYRCYCI